MYSLLHSWQQASSSVPCWNFTSYSSMAWKNMKTNLMQFFMDQWLRPNARTLRIKQMALRRWVSQTLKTASINSKFFIIEYFVSLRNYKFWSWFITAWLSIHTTREHTCPSQEVELRQIWMRTASKCQMHSRHLTQWQLKVCSMPSTTNNFSAIHYRSEICY